MKTTVAKCAALIRKELKGKFPDTIFRVTSENYSMGNNINVDWVGGPTEDDIKLITSKYVYGKFDGMTDMYDTTNNQDFPQTKFLFTNRENTIEENTAIIDLINKMAGIKAEISETSTGSKYIKQIVGDIYSCRYLVERELGLYY